MTSNQASFRICGREPVLRNEDWIRVQFENRDPLEVPISVWVDFGLKIGLCIDGSVMEKLETESAVRGWKQVALRYVSYRPRTREELKRYLAKKGADESIVARVTQLGEHEGWLRDEDYAREFVQSRQGKASRREVSWKLGQRGVKDVHIEPVLTEEWSTEDEYQAARKLAEKFVRAHKEDSADRLRQRLWGHLQRKGFDVDMIRRVASEFTEELESIAHREFLDND